MTADASSSRDALQQLASANLKNAREYVMDRIDEVAERAADASSTFSIAAPPKLVEASAPMADEIEQYVGGLVERLTRDTPPGAAAGLVAALAPVSAYTRGWLEGGGAAVAIQNAFPAGDWDDARKVEAVLRDQMEFLVRDLDSAVDAWVAQMEWPAPVAEAPPTPPTPPPAPAREARKAAPETPADRLTLLLAFAGDLGVRIKTVPSNPSDKWVGKLEAKLRQIAEKKGKAWTVPEPGAEPEPQPDALVPGDLEKLAEYGEPDETREISRADLPVLDRARIEAMLEKAERAELKLGRVPDEPTQGWLEETEQRLKDALEKRKAARKAEREKKQRQRKDRISRLEKSAKSLGVELGRIPPFPTDDWLARAEMRVATQMLRGEDEDRQDTGRAETLASLIARASEVDFDLDVPPDPDELWFAWAETKIADAEQGDELLFAGEDPEQAVKIGVLLFEEGTVQEQTWRLEGERTTIGRTRKNDIALPHDAQVSRNHCVVLFDGESWSIEDLDSTRGTLVNGDAIEAPTALASGDRLMVGDTEFVFRA